MTLNIGGYSNHIGGYPSNDNLKVKGVVCPDPTCKRGIVASPASAYVRPEDFMLGHSFYCLHGTPPRPKKLCVLFGDDEGWKALDAAALQQMLDHAFKVGQLPFRLSELPPQPNVVDLLARLDNK